MGEHTKSRAHEPAAEPRLTTGVTGTRQALNGPLAASVQSHAAGIGLGVVGLLIGALAAGSPLIAVAGLVGGIAAGTVFFDRQQRDINSIAHDPQMTPSRGHTSPESPPVTTASNALLASIVADYDHDCSDETPAVPAPVPASVGTTKPTNRRIR